MSLPLVTETNQNFQRSHHPPLHHRLHDGAARAEHVTSQNRVPFGLHA